MQFNQIDRSNDDLAVDRTSFLGKYDIVDGLPWCDDASGAVFVD